MELLRIVLMQTNEYLRNSLSKLPEQKCKWVGGRINLVINSLFSILRLKKSRSLLPVLVSSDERQYL